MTTPLSSLPHIKVSCSDQLSREQEVEWQNFLSNARHQHPRQDLRFAAVEQADGYEVRFGTARSSSGELLAVALLALRPHPILPHSYSEAICYSGPVCDDAPTMVAFLSGLHQHMITSRVGRMRITPFWVDSEARMLHEALSAHGWTVSEAEPYRQTGWVDLTQPMDVVQSNFSKSARREMRRSERQGVTVTEITDRTEAEEFLGSLNRLHATRGLPSVGAKSFLVAFDEIHSRNDIGVILGARHEEHFIGALLINRSGHVAHGRYFTTEPGQLRALSNLRIAPTLWFEGMRWAQTKGCFAFDVEGWYKDTHEGDKKYNIYKYKSEFSPRPVLRISERSRRAHTLAFLLTGGGRRKIRSAIRLLLRG